MKDPTVSPNKRTNRVIRGDVEVKLAGVPLEPVGYVKAPTDANELAERLSKLNRHQRRGVIARAKKQARVAKKGGKK